MRRAIVVPAVVAGAALDELKAWLAIAGPREDAMLGGLLRAGLELCEAFTGQMPLEATCEELLPAWGGWQALHTRPVQEIAAVEGIPTAGPRFALAPSDYLIELDAHGGARIQVRSAGAATRVAVRFTAGMASTWGGLPEGIRHGVLRLAAHQYRERDLADARPVPPAAIAALWRPWRRMRLT